jgi:glycosyltransferase involved in cell wall biosynthesis
LKDKDCFVQYFYFQEMPDFRKGERWTSDGGTKIHWMSFFNLLVTMIRSDVVFFLGAIRPLPWQILLLTLSCLMRKKVFVASEGLKTRSFSKLIKAIFSVLSPHFTLLAMGKGCKGDFKRLGFNGRCLKFSFYESYPKLDHAINKKKYSAPIVRILLVGQLIKRKNFELVLNSLRDYHGKKRIRVDIAGNGQLLRKLSSIANDVMKNKNITVYFHGHIEAEALNDFFKKATLFACPSLYEGWGVVLNHALHYGLPILALNSVRSAEGYLVNDKVNGRISTLDSFKNDLLKMIDSDLSSMSDNSFKLNEYWKLEVAKDRFIKIIQSNERFKLGVFSELV